MRNLLFLSVHYGIEGIEHGRGVVNGFTAYSEMLVQALAEFAVVDVVTDRPDGFPESRCLDLFRPGLRMERLEEFWRSEFPVRGAGDGAKFSRDTLYRLFQMGNFLHPEALDRALSDPRYDAVVLNRHEYFFLARHPALEGKEVILCAHDSNYLRKRSYELVLGVEQPLTHVEESLERALVGEADTLVCLSSTEQQYFSSIPGVGRVVLYRPRIEEPETMVSLDLSRGINFYFIGANNFVNRDTLQSALALFRSVGRVGLDRFHVFGSISQAVPETVEPEVVLHGQVESLEHALRDMHVLVAPIRFGSGIPIKIADALSLGHLVAASEFAAASYREFIGRRIVSLPDNGWKQGLWNGLASAVRDRDPYVQYSVRNREAARSVVEHRREVGRD